MIEAYLTILALLVFAHNLADYPLQSDFLAQGKNRNTALGKVFWPHCLAAHSVIHGGFVGVITGSLYLAIAETAIHAATDFAKCEGKISMRVDQSIHYGCKFLWAGLFVGGFL